MKIRDAKQAYASQLDILREKKQALAKLLKEQEQDSSGISGVDSLELSRELSRTEAQYEATQGVMAGILERESAIHNSEAARQQSEAMAEEGEKIAKMMEVFRRISSGAKVPPGDEQKLMEFNHELYMAAKSAALMAQGNDEEYDSLWEEEEDAAQEPDAHEIAEDTEISVAPPEDVAQAAADSAGYPGF